MMVGANSNPPEGETEMEKVISDEAVTALSDAIGNLAKGTLETSIMANTAMYVALIETMRISGTLSGEDVSNILKRMEELASLGPKDVVAVVKIITDQLKQTELTR
jgi:hypothetical protein